MTERKNAMNRHETLLNVSRVQNHLNYIIQIKSGRWKLSRYSRCIVYNSKYFFLSSSWRWDYIALYILDGVTNLKNVFVSSCRLENIQTSMNVEHNQERTEPPSPCSLVDTQQYPLLSMLCNEFNFQHSELVTLWLEKDGNAVHLKHTDRIHEFN